MNIATPEEIKCPDCASDDVNRLHYQESFAFPECWYWCCNECGYQWGHG